MLAGETITGRLVEYLITDADVALEEARKLVVESSKLDGEQKKVFEQLCERLTSKEFSLEILGLAYQLVEKHIQYERYPPLEARILRIQIRNSIKKAKKFSILPEFLLVIIEFRGLLLVAEHAEGMRMHAHRSQQPVGYNASFKRPYFKAIRESLLKLKELVPDWLPNLKFILWRDRQFEVFGRQPTPLARRRRKIESAFGSAFLSDCRIDKISNLQFLIFKARNWLDDPEEAELNIERIVEIFSGDRNLYCSLVGEIVDVRRLICARWYRSGALRAYMRSVFNLIRFADESMNHASEKYQQLSFILNYEIGMALLASRRGAESERFFRRSLFLLEEACGCNILVSKYLAWFRFFIEAAIFQGRRDPEMARICMRVCVDRLEEVGKLPRFNLPMLHEIQNDRFQLIWNTIVNFPKYVEVTKEHGTEDFLELADWSNLIGLDIIEGRQRFDFTRMNIEKCLKVVEEGTQEIKIENEIQLHHCNLGEFFLPGWAGAYLQLNHAATHKSTEQIIEHVEKFYWDIVNRTIDPKFLKSHGIHYSLVALHMCEESLDSDPVIELPPLIIFAIEQFENEIASLAYSITSIVLEHFRKIAKCIKHTTRWDFESIGHVIRLLENVFLKMEIHRQSILDDDDRACMEKVLQEVYSDVAGSFFTILERSEEAALKKMLIKAIIVYLDRSQLRWLRSLLSDGLRSKIMNLSVPEEIKQGFLVSEEALRAFLAIHNDQIVLGGGVMDSGTLLPAIKRGIKFSRPNGANVSSPADEKTEYSKRHRQFIESLYLIQQHCPDFEWQMLKEVFLNIDHIFLSDKNIPRTWIRMIDDRIVIVMMFRKKVKIEISQKEDAEKIINWCEEACRNGGSENKVGEIVDSGFFRSVGTVIDALFSKWAHSGTGVVRLFVDSGISTFPFHERLFPKREYRIVHSPSSSISAQNRKSPLSLEHVLMACPHKNLGFAPLETKICWRAGHVSDCRYLLDENRDDPRDLKNLLNNASVFHYIGHVNYDGGAGGEPYLFLLDGIPINLKWIAGNVQFSRGAIVILNACKSGAVLGTSVIESFDRSKEYVFRKEFLNERVSFATVFLACGASAVIATTEEVDDFAALLFGWKFSTLAEESKKPDVEKIFFATLAWCKSIRKFSDLAEVVDDIEYFCDEIYADRPTLLFEQGFHELENTGVLKSSRYWSPFVIYR